MFARLPNALVRAVMVIFLIITPSLILPGNGVNDVQIVTLVTVFAALFTIVEYSATSPSLVEFRDAPPFNRLRFSALFATVFMLSVIFRGDTAPSTFTSVFLIAGQQASVAMDFPYSPVRLMTLMMPSDSSMRSIDAMRMAAGISYLMSLLSIAWFIVMLRLRHWPSRSGAFNVWINLPTFDPTAGGDVVKRLNRDGQLNLILGILLPFLIPAVLKVLTALGSPIRLDDPQTLIWTVAAWAFLPASLLMRGVGLGRVAQMIHIQRKRAYAKAAQEGVLAA